MRNNGAFRLGLVENVVSLVVVQLVSSEAAMHQSPFPQEVGTQYR